MKYSMNHVRKQIIGNKFLLTTDFGTWAALDREVVSLLESGKLVDESVLSDLEKKGIIITERNSQLIIDKTRERNIHLFNPSSLHIVVPTLRCNHKCLYCHSKVVPENAEGYDMDHETAKKTVDFMFQCPGNAITVEFQGGEPLLNFERIQDITEMVKEKNKTAKKDVLFDIVTNLSAMDHDIIKYLIKNNFGICTSLDGPAEVHNKNRVYLGGNSHEKVTYWIKEIKQDYNYSVDALMVATKYSLPYWKEIIDEYKKNDLHWIKLRFLDKLGFAEKTADKIDYSAEEYLDYWKKSMDYLIEVNKSYELRERMSEYILSKMFGIWANYTDFQNPCGAVIGQLAYAQDGNIYTCDEGRQYDMFKIGNVFKDNYKEVVTSGKACSMVSASVNENLLCDACVYKPYCGVCPVCTYAETGSMIPKLGDNKRCKIYKEMFDYYFKHIISGDSHGKLFMDWVKNSTILSRQKDEKEDN